MSEQSFWITLALLAVGTFTLRYVGLAGNSAREPSKEWARALRYAPVAIFPAMAAPMLAFDASGALQTDPARLTATAVALVVGVWTRSLLWTIAAGMAAVWAGEAALLALHS